MAEAVVSPPHDGSVSFEAQTVDVARGHTDEIGIGRGDVGLTVVVASPRHDGAVGLESQAVPLARGDGDKTRVGRGDVSLTGAVESPRHDRALVSLRPNDSASQQGHTRPSGKSDQLSAFHRLVSSSSAARCTRLVIELQEMRRSGFRPRLDAESGGSSSPSLSRRIRRQIA